MEENRIPDFESLNQNLDELKQHLDVLKNEFETLLQQDPDTWPDPKAVEQTEQKLQMYRKQYETLKTAFETDLGETLPDTISKSETILQSKTEAMQEIRKFEAIREEFNLLQGKTDSIKEALKKEKEKLNSHKTVDHSLEENNLFFHPYEIVNYLVGIDDEDMRMTETEKHAELINDSFSARMYSGILSRNIHKPEEKLTEKEESVNPFLPELGGVKLQCLPSRKGNKKASAKEYISYLKTKNYDHRRIIAEILLANRGVVSGTKNLSKAITTLFDMGYLNNYELTGFGHFYALSPKGKNTYKLKTVLDFIPGKEGNPENEYLNVESLSMPEAVSLLANTKLWSWLYDFKQQLHDQDADTMNPDKLFATRKNNFVYGATRDKRLAPVLFFTPTCVSEEDLQQGLDYGMDKARFLCSSEEDKETLHVVLVDFSDEMARSRAEILKNTLLKDRNVNLYYGNFDSFDIQKLDDNSPEWNSKREIEDPDDMPAIIEEGIPDDENDEPQDSIPDEPYPYALKLGKVSLNVRTAKTLANFSQIESALDKSIGTDDFDYMKLMAYAGVVPDFGIAKNIQRMYTEGLLEKCTIQPFGIGYALTKDARTVAIANKWNEENDFYWEEYGDLKDCSRATLAGLYLMGCMANLKERLFHSQPDMEAESLVWGTMQLTGYAVSQISGYYPVVFLMPYSQNASDVQAVLGFVNEHLNKLGINTDVGLHCVIVDLKENFAKKKAEDMAERLSDAGDITFYHGTIQDLDFRPLKTDMKKPWLCRLDEDENEVEENTVSDESADSETDTESEPENMEEAAETEPSESEVVPEDDTSVETSETESTEEIEVITEEEHSDLPLPDSSLENSAESEEQQAAEEEIVTLSDEERADVFSNYNRMLNANRFDYASAYLHSFDDPVIRKRADQLSMALYDPLYTGSYNSAQVLEMFDYETEEFDPLYLSAGLRSFFYGNSYRDFTRSDLKKFLNVHSDDHVSKEVMQLIHFMEELTKHSEVSMATQALLQPENRKNLQMQKAEYVSQFYTLQDRLRTRARKINAVQLAMTMDKAAGDDSFFSLYITALLNDDFSVISDARDFLMNDFLKDGTALEDTIIDSNKIENYLISQWKEAKNKAAVEHKEFDINRRDKLRDPLKTYIRNAVKESIELLIGLIGLAEVIQNYNQSNSPEFQKTSAGMLTILDDLQDNYSLEAKDEMLVLFRTLNEIRDCLNGTNSVSDRRYFYKEFLKCPQLRLNEQYLPILDNPESLPEMASANRLLNAFEHVEKYDTLTFDERLDQARNGEDNFGTEILIQNLMKELGLDSSLNDYNPLKMLENDLVKNSIKNRMEDFDKEIWLAQSYGRLDEELNKESLNRMAAAWKEDADRDKNYGYLYQLLDAMTRKIENGGEARKELLERKMADYKKEHPDWRSKDSIRKRIDHFDAAIESRNFTAADDIFNRLSNNEPFTDIHADNDTLNDFLNEYTTIYSVVSNNGKTLRELSNKLFNMHRSGSRKAGDVIRAWPTGDGKSRQADVLEKLMIILGFDLAQFEKGKAINNNYSVFEARLKKPENGQRKHYLHPIAEFGSEAETKIFKVIPVFGNKTPEKLLPIIQAAAKSANVLIILDCALTLADRRELSYLLKKEHMNHLALVLDRVGVYYLAKHYDRDRINQKLIQITVPFAYTNPYKHTGANLPQEMFIGRKKEISQIESENGIQLLYGGRQLGKSALLYQAAKDLDHDEAGRRAIVIEIGNQDPQTALETIVTRLLDAKILKNKPDTLSWINLRNALISRFDDPEDPLPFLLLMLDEADYFIAESAKEKYRAIYELTSLRDSHGDQFNFILCGLRNVVRFSENRALDNNSPFAKLNALTVKPFEYVEAKELLEAPLSYLGFEFPDDQQTDILEASIFDATNSFPGMIQLYCANLVNALQVENGGYDPYSTPPYPLQEELLKQMIGDERLKKSVQEKLDITLRLGDDPYYEIIALMIALLSYEDPQRSGFGAKDILNLSKALEIIDLASLSERQIETLLDEMVELNVLQPASKTGEYNFARFAYRQMLGNHDQVEDKLEKYMETQETAA